MLNKIKALLEQNKEGCSINPKTGELVNANEGYFVSLTDNEVQADIGEEIKKLQCLANSLHLQDYCYGYWQDEQTGKCYFDISIHLDDAKVALYIAYVFGQKAIFDCKNSESIYVDKADLPNWSLPSRIGCLK